MGKYLSLKRQAAVLAVAAFLGGTVIATPAFATNGGTPPPPPPSSSSSSPSSSSPSPIGSSSVAEPPANRFIVKFRDKAGITAVERLDTYSAVTTTLGAQATELFETGTGASVVEVDRELTQDQSAAVVAALAAKPDVEYVEPDVRLFPAALDPNDPLNPNDPLYSQQWSLWEPEGGAAVSAAWAVSRGAGQVVAVVDTGITNHSDLNAQILPGTDLISSPSMARDGDARDGDPRDEGDWNDSGNCSVSRSTWHGTHVTGTVAASANNGMGISGIAPAAKVVPVRVLGECGGYLSDISDGIIWAAGGTLPDVGANGNPANVINLSLGGISACSPSMQEAVNYAAGRKAVVVVAAGNSNRPAADSTPANCQNVIAVGAAGRDGSRAPYSNYGAAVDIMAPGGNMSPNPAGGILSTLNEGWSVPQKESYSLAQGTSMAAPHVAGAAALLLAAYPEMTPDQVEARLKATARDLPNGCTPHCGPKLLDTAAAVTMPLVAPVPAISGTAAVGATLTAEPGTWAPAPVDLAYQWYRGNTAVHGATGATYKLTGADHGQAISVGVSGSKPGYTTVTKRSAATAKVTPAQPPFADVAAGTQFYDEMLWMATAGISTGWTEVNGARTYRPLQAVNRDAMAAFLYRLDGSPDFTPPAQSPFTDVATTNPFYKEITWLNSRGISTGWAEANGTKTYRPLSPVNRDAMAAFMYRFAASPSYSAPKPAFVDVPKDSLFYKEISWLAASGITTGWGAGTYQPLSPVNRDAMAAFMKRFDATFLQ